MTTTSSSERPARRVIAAVDATALRPVATPDLRTGHWARHAGVGLGDRVTEDLLGTAVEDARRVARAQGWSAGWADGMRAAREATAAELTAAREAAHAGEQRRAAEHGAAVAALREAAQQLLARTEQAEAEVAEQAVGLALAVTEAVLGAAAAAQTPHELVQRALRAAAEDPCRQVVVRVPGPTAAAVGADEVPDHVTLRADASLAAGDAVVELDDTVVDLRVASALRRVREVLS